MPESTVEFDGLDLYELIGGFQNHKKVLPNFDLRAWQEEQIERILKRVISEVMTLEPAVTFDATS